MPPELDGITARLLAKEKEQRYQSAEEVLQDLEALDANASHGSSGRVAAASATHPAVDKHPATELSRPPGKARR
jgi:hypothetical protein